MTRLFADTFYYLALLSPGDGAHAEAVAISRRRNVQTVTTEFVLLELADGLATVSRRTLAAGFIGALHRNPHVAIIPVGEELFSRGLSLYTSRPDKDWTLTDCTSFVAMQDHRLTEALTGDHHYVQAGFSIVFNS